MINHTHDPIAVSWVAGAAVHPDFPVQNLPLGIFSPDGGSPRAGTVIGDFCLDLSAIAPLLGLNLGDTLAKPTLNDLLALPAGPRMALRVALFDILTDAQHERQLAAHLYPVERCVARLPTRIGDYTDFYVGINHATNVGRLFRPDNPLLPNYKHLPIGYHGRASSVRAAPSRLIRPSGQIRQSAEEGSRFAPTAQLDYELELGAWIGGTNDLGDTVPIARAWDRIAGISLLNDWSARDIQAWEYQPLGPFLAKNFLTTVSPWIITTEALAPFRVAPTERPSSDPLPLPYLYDPEDAISGGLALSLEATLSTRRMREENRYPLRISKSSAQFMYWTFAQMVAHHTSNGCNLEPGDLIGTGTISGPSAGSEGSLLETTHAGAQPLTMSTGEIRGFLEDGDEINLTARAEQKGYRSIGFGSCLGVVEAAPT